MHCTSRMLIQQYEHHNHHHHDRDQRRLKKVFQKMWQKISILLPGLDLREGIHQIATCWPQKILNFTATFFGGNFSKQCYSSVAARRLGLSSRPSDISIPFFLFANIFIVVVILKITYLSPSIPFTIAHMWVPSFFSSYFPPFFVLLPLILNGGKFTKISLSGQSHQWW